MPCRDYSTHEGVDYESRRKLDNVTEMLCSVLTALSEDPKVSRLLQNNKKLRNWWEKHQEQDRRRLADEARELERKRKKQRAISKLTDEERKLLGL